MTGKGFLDTLAVSFTVLITGALEALFGKGVRQPIVGAFTWADLGTLAVVVLLVVLLNGAAASFLRRKTRQAEADLEATGWRPLLWRTLGWPLYLMIWVYGIYFAATPILLKVAPPGEYHPARQVANRLFDIGIVVALFVLFLKVTHLLENRLKAWAGRTSSKYDDLVVPLLGKSLRVIVPVIGVIFALPMAGFSPASETILARGSSILIICTVAYILFNAVGLGQKTVLARYDIKAADNLQARKVYTQVHVLTRTLHVIIAIFTIASILMLFDEVRRFGTSMLASAGVVGIIIGFAAQRTIANLFAGFQVAMTQPIRMDDVVIVENEWGRIEDITLTYVVVRIWDDRRLVVPLSYFIEKPFQNWTRSSASILGSVLLWMDYSVPVAQLRPALQRIVESCPNWDGRFWNLQVTDASEKCLQLRVLLTSSDASKSWDARCEVREKLVAFLQERYPSSLPRIRAELDRDAGDKAGAELEKS